MKRAVRYAAIGLAVILVCLFFARTVAVMDHVYIENFTLSPDGQTMTIQVAVGVSVGYTRSVTVKDEGDALCLVFHPAYGGINGKIGAKSPFVIPLTDDCDRIYIHTDDVFQRGLRRTSDGAWEHYLHNTLPVPTN